MKTAVPRSALETAPAGARSPLAKPSEKAKTDQGGVPVKPAKQTAIAMKAPLLDVVRPEKEELPRPTTTKITRDDVEAFAWLHCQPLPAIPLGISRTVVVGRQDDCDLVLPHKEVSRHHATFKTMGKQIILEDGGSSNGTYLNGKRVTNQSVKIGDVITVGPYELEIHAKQHVSEALGDTNRWDTTRAAMAAGEGTSFSGKIGDVSLVEILQQIEFNKKTGTLSVAEGTRRGQLLVAEGKPVTASWGEKRDADAVREMLKLKVGRFAFSGEVEPQEPTMRQTITAILLDASREIDEAGAPKDAPAPAPEEAKADEPPTAVGE